MDIAVAESIEEVSPDREDSSRLSETSSQIVANQRKEIYSKLIQQNHIKEPQSACIKPTQKLNTPEYYHGQTEEVKNEVVQVNSYAEA